MKSSHSLRALFGLAILGLSATSARAALIGSDSASDVAYNGGWNNGTDGGTPGTFGAWLLTNTGANSGRFIGDSTTLAPGNTGANINTAGESFGMFGHTGQTSEAFRDFNGSTLGIGETFSVELAANFRNGQKGFDLRNSADVPIFNFNIGNLGSGDDYTVQFATTGNGSIGNTYSANSEFLLSFTQTTLAGGTWSIVRSGGVTDSDTGTYSGLAENFKLYETITASGANENNLFINSLTVIPEPTQALLGMFVGSCFLFRRRRM